MSTTKQMVKIIQCAKNKENIIDEGKLKKFVCDYYDNSNSKPLGVSEIKPKLVLILDSVGGITAIGLGTSEIGLMSDLSDLKEKFKDKFKSEKPAQTNPTMPSIRFSDGISILGLGDNSCEWISCNGDLVYVCD